MNYLIDPLKNLDSYKGLILDIEKGTSPIGTYGIIGESTGHILYGLREHSQRQILLITYDEVRARKIYEDLKNLGNREVYLLPRKELLLYNIDALSNEGSNKRLEIMSKLVEDEDMIIIASIESILDKIMSKKLFEKYSQKINSDDRIDLDKTIDIFINGGYERVAMVEGVGQFSVRGGIIDFFSPNNENPYRIELFDDEVDSIRTFDILTQRSIEILDYAYIRPVKETLIIEDYREDIIKNLEKDLKKLLSKSKGIEKQTLEEKFYKYIEDLEEKQFIPNRDMIIPFIPEEYLSSILAYLKKDALIYLDEPRRIEEKVKNIGEDFHIKYSDLYEVGELLSSHINLFYDYEEIVDKIKEKICITNSGLLTKNKYFDPKSIHRFTIKEMQSYNSKMEILKEDINEYKYKGYKLIIFSGTEERGKRLEEMLLDMDVETTYVEDRNREIKSSQVFIRSGSIQGGFEYTDLKLALISDKDVFGAGKNKTRKASKKTPRKAVSFSDLHINDYVVHENHGIGKYEGVEQLNIQGIKKDYLTIRYRGEDKLYVPIDQMNLIQKYIGADSINPRVNKLASGEWEKTKLRARKVVEDMADDLIELYAKRESLEGHAFPKDDQWQRQFEDLFPHEETDGQLNSANEIKRDMEKAKPMDRLLCGDVGYGKTEVALRAAFKAVLDGKQVAILVPTTILAQQHYNTIVERFASFPIKIAMLSRFRTKAQQKSEIEGIRKGTIDIVVGTHRLLSKDVIYKDLGLLIIDEEQRFGVKHKETLQSLKESIDVLTLTATPIPRTLHMSLSGIRDMSVIEDPPEERYPVQTYVVEFNEQMIRDAILKEMARGGQVYFVYNRVQTIDSFTAKLKELVPEARFAIGHGQMGERKLEEVMLDFYEKEYDVLVCTTIIETGLDIPNVNTIIINDADKMGLSQLYQLRGRVGRSNRIAYGYFTYEKDKVLREVAEKRLRAIKEFTEFGSGFKIAMRDLEIRGAGNLLGSQQHGEIEAIGYDLYVKFLSEAINKMKGEPIEEKVDTTIDLEVDGFIKDNYIQDEEQKIEVYKKIAAVESENDYMELIDELIDRFGDVPKEVGNLMDISYIRALGSKNKIKNIIQSSNQIILEFTSTDKLTPDLLNALSREYGQKISFNLSASPSFRFSGGRNILFNLKTLLEKINGFNQEKSDI